MSKSTREEVHKKTPKELTQNFTHDEVNFDSLMKVIKIVCKENVCLRFH